MEEQTAGVENAGVEKAGVDSSGGKLRSKSYGRTAIHSRSR